MNKRTLIFIASFLILLAGLLANTYAQKPRESQLKSSADSIQSAKPAAVNQKIAAADGKEAAGKRKQAAAAQSAPQVQRGQMMKPSVGQPVRFAVTPRLRDLKLTRATVPTPDKLGGKEKPPVRTIPNQELMREKYAAGLMRSEDGAVQRVAPEPNMPLPDVTFEGANNRDNALVFGGRVVPPDTQGDVGPSHYVQSVNLVTNIYDKAGNLLVGPFAMSDLFASIGGVCANTDSGDPISLYDHLADRWLISQFAVVGPPFHQCIAISQTPDPTGAYYVYDYVMPNTKFNDYPHFGVWPDGYYMMDHQFNANVTSFEGSGAFAFDRNKMLAGDPTASFIYFDLQFLDPGIGGHLPADLDGPPPPAGTPNYFAMFRADEFGDPFDGIEVFEFAADFSDPSLSTFVSITTIPIASFDPVSRAGRGDIDQPPPATTSHRVDAIGDRLMHRLQYRNFGTFESLVSTHTVDVSGDPSASVYQAGVRYFELRRTLPAGLWMVNEVATFAPNTDHRWMASAAMDGNGNLAVGYSISSLTTFPGINVAGRFSSDPPNGLWQGESVFQVGNGSQTASGTGQRWGDYSAMSIDPVDDCRFWYTQEYYPASNALCPTNPSTVCWHTRIVSFEFPGCVAATQGTITGHVYDSIGNPVEAARVILEDAHGNFWETATDSSGFYSRLLSPGVYSAFARANNYDDSPSTNVNVPSVGSISQDFNLGAAHPVVVLSGFTIDDTNGNGNGTIDFNECVDLVVELSNIGAASATGVSASLTSNTPNVTVGHSPADYTDIPVGGSASNATPYTVSIHNTFACFDDINLTMWVSTDDGNFSFPVVLPTGPPPLTFSDAGGPFLIPDSNPGGVSIPITVSGFVGTITDLNVSLHITHTWDGDLDISLIGPGGSPTINLSSDNGGGSDNYGGDCATRTVFDDEAGTTITAGSPPFVGRFIPEAPLSTFDGLDPNGTWTLFVSDDFVGDVGQVECVSLEFPVPCSDGGGVCADAVPNLVIGDPVVSGGNGDDDVDENDCVDVAFPITNIGTADASNVRATISSGNPNITILQNLAWYGDIVVNDTISNLTPFQVATTVCPDNTTFDVTIEADQATKWTNAGLLSTASFSAEPQVLIPDNNGPAFGPIHVSGMAGTVTNVKTTVRVSHTWNGDLDLILEAPDGTQALLTTFPNGGSGDGYGIDCPADGNDTTFDDAAGTAIGAGSSPFSGSFQPEDPMATFNGVDPNGTWNLIAFDTYGGDLGIIHCWKLELETGDCDDAGGTCSQDPVLSINNRALSEGDSGTTNFVFTAHISFPIGTDVTADADTSDGSATTANNDYSAVNTSINITAGNQDDYIVVPVQGDTDFEPDEQFFVDLSSISGNAIPLITQGTGTILNDDPCTVLITLAPTTLPDAQKDDLYPSTTIVPSGGTPPYTFAVTSGGLPDGLMLDSDTGEVSGTPTTVGTFDFDITATDSLGCSGTQSYTVNITEPCLYCDEFDDFTFDWTEIKPGWSENGTDLIGNPVKKAIAIAPSLLFPGCQICSIEASMSTAGGSGNVLWLLGWYLDKKDTMELLLKEDSGKLLLKQKIGGAVVKKQKATVTLNPNFDHIVRIEFDGAQFEVFLDTVSVMTFVPAGAVPSGTVGFQVKNTIGTFDYIHVEN